MVRIIAFKFIEFEHWNLKTSALFKINHTHTHNADPVCGQIHKTVFETPKKTYSIKFMGIEHDVDDDSKNELRYVIIKNENIAQKKNNNRPDLKL